MDHLYPPGLPTVPSFEAWTTAAALAGVTERVRLGHLVLANGFRHPALLAKMAITLDHASGGRLALGLGSGSHAPEFAEFGLDFPKAAERAGRLAEALEVIRLLFTADAPSYDGRYYRLRPAPRRRARVGLRGGRLLRNAVRRRGAPPRARAARRAGRRLLPSRPRRAGDAPPARRGGRAGRA